MSIKEKIINRLVSVKSIVTLGMLILVAFLAVRGNITGEEIQKLFWVIIAFYFGTQVEKRTSAGAEDDTPTVIAPDGSSAEDLLIALNEATGVSFADFSKAATKLVDENGEATSTEATGFALPATEDNEEG